MVGLGEIADGVAGSVLLLQGLTGSACRRHEQGCGGSVAAWQTERMLSRLLDVVLACTVEAQAC